MRFIPMLIVVMSALLSGDSELRASEGILDGTRVVWHPLALTFHGPVAKETDDRPNPFLDYRLIVTLTAPTGQQQAIPGFFAGDAAGNGAGSCWRIRFSPDCPGGWRYRASFRFAITEGKAKSADQPIIDFGWNLKPKDRAMTFRHLDFKKPQVPRDLPLTRQAETDDYLAVGSYGGGSDHFSRGGAGIYGFNWWFNDTVRGQENRRTWPDAPTDLFMSVGARGNSAAMLPSRALSWLRPMRIGVDLNRVNRMGE